MSARTAEFGYSDHKAVEVYMVPDITRGRSRQIIPQWVMDHKDYAQKIQQGWGHMSPFPTEESIAEKEKKTRGKEEFKRWLQEGMEGDMDITTLAGEEEGQDSTGIQDWWREFDAMV